MWRLALLLALVLAGPALARPVVIHTSPADATIAVFRPGRPQPARYRSGEPIELDASDLSVAVSRDGWMTQDLPASQVPSELTVRLVPQSIAAWAELVPWPLVLGVIALGVWSLQRRRHALQRARTLIALAEQSQDGAVRIGRYRMMERLGGGGMAEIHRAVPEDTLDATQAVAIKLMRQPDNPAARQRFAREINICRTLDHPAIVRLINWGTGEDGQVHLVMELLEGETLRQRMGDAPFAPAAAWKLLEPLMEAIAYAHRHGVVHRDLKPENVMLTKGGHLKVLDFGVARACFDERVTDPGSSVGTARSMAPEQLQGNADAKSDQYALGLIAYEMLSGRHPCEVHTEREIIAWQLSPRPHPALQGVPEPLAAVVMRMIAKDPQARYRSVDDAVAAFRAAL